MVACGNLMFYRLWLLRDVLVFRGFLNTETFPIPLYYGRLRKWAFDGSGCFKMFLILFIVSDQADVRLFTSAFFRVSFSRHS